MAKISHSFPDHNQNFWQLTCIQSAAQSIPGILTGGILAQKFGVNVALSSIFIGNLILWLVGLAVISMAAKERKNAIESTKDYLGKSGSLLLSIILLIAFLSWYMLEIQAATTVLTPLLTSQIKFSPILFGSIFGILIALISMGGIVAIRKIATKIFPVLLFFIVYSILSSNGIAFNEGWELSFSAILTVALITLPGMVLLPTFFRHSKSQADSFFALTLITLADILFQSFSIFTQTTNPSEFLPIHGGFHLSLAVLFTILSLISLNLVNIYYSSAALQTIAPKLVGPKGYLCIGLIGTASYIFLRDSSVMLFLENMTNNFIANIGVMLILSFLVSIVVKHRPRSLEKTISFSCWAIGCLIALIVLIINPQFPEQSLLIGCGGIILIFLAVLFFEETNWAVKKIYK